MTSRQCAGSDALAPTAARRPKVGPAADLRVLAVRTLGARVEALASIAACMTPCCSDASRSAASTRCSAQIGACTRSFNAAAIVGLPRSVVGSPSRPAGLVLSARLPPLPAFSAVSTGAGAGATTPLLAPLALSPPAPGDDGGASSTPPLAGLLPSSPAG